MKRVLVLGRNGMVGKEIDNPEIEIYGPSRDACNISNPAHISSFLSSIKPDVIINAAGFTDVDAAEKDKYYEAFEVNCNGPFHLAKAIADSKRDTKLVHISSDFVFAGRHAPYSEENTDEVPVNAYGMSKLFGDILSTKLCEEAGIKLAIIRTSWVFGSGRPNFPEAILKKLLNTSEPVRVVDDQVGVPTLAKDLAEACVNLAIGDRVGLFNFRNSGESCSRYTWARSIVRAAFSATGRKEFSVERILPCATDDLPRRAAKRPFNTTLSIDKYGPTPDWETATISHVEKVLKEWPLL
jgi:dTDP-4-dehydrorhamnose reductase